MGHTSTLFENVLLHPHKTILLAKQIRLKKMVGGGRGGGGGGLKIIGKWDTYEIFCLNK